MVRAKADLAVSATFRQRMEEVRDDIAAGRIKFYNGPPEWTEQLLTIMALNCVLLLLAQEARWN